ncbi:MAG: PIN domain-containing protein [Sporichthyaceae bacterium]|nr:PIN domain-containing protein [Sporichthyaceae bacterium]
MSLVLDAGGVSALAARRELLVEIRARGLWPPRVPTIVLAEALTGDHRRDHPTNRLLRTCQVRKVDEVQAREAARLRTATGRAGSISAVDAVVAALAATQHDAFVLTSDPRDLRALAEHTARPVTVVVA